MGRLPCVKNVRFRTLQNTLLGLCLLTFLLMVVVHKDRILQRVAQSFPATKPSELTRLTGILKDTNRHPSAVNKSLEMATQESQIPTKSSNMTTMLPDLINKGNGRLTKRISSKVTTESSKITLELASMTAKHSETTTEPPIVTTKPSRITTQSSTVTTKHTITTKPPNVPRKPSRITPRETKENSEIIHSLTKAREISTTLSYLGDAYGWDNTYLNSSCPNRTRDKLKSNEFNETFVNNIPVLQWKIHAILSEYQRLKRYLGTYGWKGLTWQILNETLNLLNSSGNGYLFDTWKGHSPCVRCAVVGNGGILNGSGMGAEIDGHDYVFRVNGAITKGYENDVGRRTSFFFFSTNTLFNSLAAYRKNGFHNVPHSQETRFLLLPDHERDYLLVRAALTNSVIDRGRDKGKRPSNYFGTNLTTEHFKILHPDFMRYLRNRYLWDPILKTKHRNIYRPTTGASMLLMAVHTCDQVSAYGFITPNYGKFSDHYYDMSFRKIVFYMNHSFLREMRLWQKLHKARVIKLYMRD
ncbi:alpha-N-acetylgalactosaminide alpha-2,6-sialyltransferase 2 [Xenopus laevis]|uniref:alpha-N-acetylgalactosaminide alpha-2,6-sialyltransferase n=2 Tax=Xenopus laevis TaxID=8355 RepID=A0A1L8ETG0_XENLA|nr:alpha-N-acetylgalactosaminide alpha-2,6-sialyltransferase 2 [Xenopus laevis]OCT62636.1 hypothetical protein XELAEV_18043722mg [Xenopus laevis]